MRRALLLAAQVPRSGVEHQLYFDGLALSSSTMDGALDFPASLSVEQG